MTGLGQCPFSVWHNYAGAGYIMFFVQEYPGDATGDHAVLTVRFFFRW